MLNILKRQVQDISYLQPLLVKLPKSSNPFQGVRFPTHSRANARGKQHCRKGQSMIKCTDLMRIRKPSSRHVSSLPPTHSSPALAQKSGTGPKVWGSDPGRDSRPHYRRRSPHRFCICKAEMTTGPSSHSTVQSTAYPTVSDHRLPPPLL